MSPPPAVKAKSIAPFAAPAATPVPIQHPQSSRKGLKILLPVAVILILGIVGGVAYWKLYLDKSRDAGPVAVQGEAGTLGRPALDQVPMAAAAGETAPAKAVPTETLTAAPAVQPAATGAQNASVAPPAVPPPTALPKAATPRAQTAVTRSTPPIKPQAIQPGAIDVVAPPVADKAAAPVTAAPPAQTADAAKQPPPVADPAPTPPAKTEATALPPPAKNVVAEDRPPPAPPQGTIQWTGEGVKGQTLTIEAGRASYGTLTGKLPGVPCIIRVQPSDVSVAEAPGPGNRFGRIVLRFSKNGRITIIVNWETLR